MNLLGVAQALSIRCRVGSFWAKDQMGLFPGTVLYSPTTRRRLIVDLDGRKLLLLP